MSDINWKDGAVCYAYGKQWFVRDNEDDDLISKEGNAFANSSNVLMRADFQLNEIREGDFIQASELDTEQKYNEVVEVFGLSGFEHGDGAEPRFKDVSVYGNLTICHDGIYATELTKKWCTRQLTYHQIIAIGKLKRMMLEHEKSAPKITADLTADKSKQAYDILKSLDYEYDLVKKRWFKKEYI